MHPRYVVALVGAGLLLVGSVFTIIRPSGIGPYLGAISGFLIAGGLYPEWSTRLADWSERRREAKEQREASTWEPEPKRPPKTPKRQPREEKPEPPTVQVIYRDSGQAIADEMKRQRRARRGNAQGCGCLLIMSAMACTFLGVVILPLLGLAPILFIVGLIVLIYGLVT